MMLNLMILGNKELPKLNLIIKWPNLTMNWEEERKVRMRCTQKKRIKNRM